MKIVLINAPYLDVYGKLNIGKNFSFSLGLGYLAAVARDKGYEVSIMEPEVYGMSDGDIISYLKEKRPDLVGISCATSNFNGAVKIARLIKEYLGTFVILGGVHASSLPEQILKKHDCFDVLVIGEGELTFLDICKHLERGNRNFADIPGITYRDNGQVVLTQPRPFIEDVDSLPFPARDLVDLDKYRPQVHLDRGKKSATMITSRGCPFRCTFCASFKTLGSRFRAHSAEYVVREIEHLVKRYKIEQINFTDDTFTTDKTRTARICNLILDKKIDIDWYCFARVDTVDYELLKLMKKAGCFSLLFGIESADETILKNIKKKITLTQAREIFKACRALKFKTLASFIFGNPGETPETIEKSIRFALEINPTIASFNKLVPFPGTEVYETYYKRYFDDNTDWSVFVGKSATTISFTEALTSRDIARYTVEAYRRFYCRPSQILRILVSIKTMKEFNAYVRGAFGIFRMVLEWRKR